MRGEAPAEAPGEAASPSKTAEDPDTGVLLELRDCTAAFKRRKLTGCDAAHNPRLMSALLLMCGLPLNGRVACPSPKNTVVLTSPPPSVSSRGRVGLNSCLRWIRTSLPPRPRLTQQLAPPAPPSHCGVFDGFRLLPRDVSGRIFALLDSFSLLAAARACTPWWHRCVGCARTPVMNRTWVGLLFSASVRTYRGGTGHTWCVYTSRFTPCSNRVNNTGLNANRDLGIAGIERHLPGDWLMITCVGVHSTHLPEPLA